MSIVTSPRPRRKRRRLTQPEREALQQEALHRATSGNSWANLPAIYAGFMGMGISEEDIQPRVNVLTYNAWKALGRQVRRGERGVKVVTWIETPEETDPATGEVTRKRSRFPRTATVFHVSQTDAIEGGAMAE